MFRSLTTLVLATAVLMVGTTRAQVKAPAVPERPGVAAGTLEFFNKTVKLAHAYVSGPDNRGGNVYRIVLSDRPVPPDSLAVELKWGGGQKLLRAGKLDGVLLNVEETGVVRVVIPFMENIRGSQSLMNAGRLPVFKVSDGVVTGQATFAKVRGHGWTLTASWHAKATPVVR